MSRECLSAASRRNYLFNNRPEAPEEVPEEVPEEGGTGGTGGDSPTRRMRAETKRARGFKDKNLQ